MKKQFIMSRNCLGIERAFNSIENLVPNKENLQFGFLQSIAAGIQMKYKV